MAADLPTAAEAVTVGREAPASGSDPLPVSLQGGSDGGDALQQLITAAGDSCTRGDASGNEENGNCVGNTVGLMQRNAHSADAGSGGGASVKLHGFTISKSTSVPTISASHPAATAAAAAAAGSSAHTYKQRGGEFVSVVHCGSVRQSAQLVSMQVRKKDRGTTGGWV